MSDFAKDFEKLGGEIVHHWMYGKEVRIPAGVTLGQHAHKHDHYSLLVRGKAMVYREGGWIANANAEGDGWMEFSAPAIIFIQAGVRHNVVAKTDVDWWCLHETEERDLDKIDAALIV